jgi:hypothetical protein
MSCGVAACKTETLERVATVHWVRRKPRPQNDVAEALSLWFSGNRSGWVMLQSNTEVMNFHVTAAPSPVHRNVQDPVRIRHSFLSCQSNRFCAFSEENSPSQSIGDAEAALLGADAQQARVAEATQVCKTFLDQAKSEENTRLRARPALRP